MLVLGKPLGVGVFGAALKKERSTRRLPELIASTTQLNTPGGGSRGSPGVHALTDVTGFGLARPPARDGRGSGVGARVDGARCRCSTDARELAADGIRHRRLGPQLGGLRRHVELPDGIGAVERALLDRSADERRAARRLRAAAVGRGAGDFDREGFSSAAVIGELEAGAPGIR